MPVKSIAQLQAELLEDHQAFFDFPVERPTHAECTAENHLFPFQPDDDMQTANPRCRCGKWLYRDRLKARKRPK